MPLRGSNHSPLVSDEAPYFKTLADLDEWMDKGRPRLNAILPYHPRNPVNGVVSGSKGKLLVCHDYKGGYTERPDALAYTFNFWSYCDTFIYFAHHRVSVPPSGWITAAHRQGVKILGTLIFEHAEGEVDALRLLVGRPPHGSTGMSNLPPNVSLPLSPHYAHTLASLARQRGFDGYLLNFETPLRGGIEQTRALAAWIAILEQELKREVGTYAQAIWYDSVIVTGQLKWQDRLNSLNLPFFLPSSAFFTNYAWPPHYPSLTAQYFLSIDSAHLTNPHPKVLNDIYVGIDVWGRGSHGGGGFASYKAIQHVDLEYLGLSVALFGPGWTWESEQDRPGWSWDVWWAYERTLWIGPEDADDVVTVPEPPEGQPNCPHGNFLPISTFFSKLPPPNPANLTFFTSFSPGVGRSWFVKGVKVLETQNGWTDVDKSSSLGDLLWPRPKLSWEHGEREETPPRAQSILDMKDAWIGGNLLRVSISVQGSDAEDAFFRCLWLPIQSIAVTPHKTYEMHLVYKAETQQSIELDVGLSVKELHDNIGNVEIISLESSTELTGGWTKLSIEFRLEAEVRADILSAVGLVIGFAQDDPTEPSNVSISLGALSIYLARPSPTVSIPWPILPWAHFERSSLSTSSLAGVLVWGVSSVFPIMTGLSIQSPEDPQPAWTLESTTPAFLYFNVYIQTIPLDGRLPNPDEAIFIGSTGLDGRKNRFHVDATSLPADIGSSGHVRFLVQGITDRGTVLPWERCTFVDVTLH
ncbi:unnamed protein product [Somion occarium]|uniref:Cytosolic endo-beta-N-acetylglucosaminidase TIM barrel domain-containing protein n=1 Tax=Somion occarium TaxID=3059160 RepID=A0ABP1D7D4_9APHY